MSTTRIGIIGLGYVGLPLAVEFSFQFPTLGYDIDAQRVNALKQHHDATGEVSKKRLQQAVDLHLTAQPQDLADCTVYIITVPTPVDANNLPDLTPLKAASHTVGQLLKPGDVVVYESTVYPGATEKECARVLSEVSGLALNRDYHLGYSPERINPGDKVNTLKTIVKVVAASNQATTERLGEMYGRIIDAGVHLAPSIKVAEAAKAIENTQRDMNIAFMNELSMMFREMHIDTLEVIETAATKWNFLPFKPGLVGGHCIGVDPYYLIHKSQESGYYPQLITTARRINEHMGEYVTERLLKLMAHKRKHVVGSRVLMLGLTFKENCPDLRNTRIIDIIESLRSYHTEIDVHDPWADAEDAARLGVNLVEKPPQGSYDLAILAVAHRQFVEAGVAAVRALLKPGGLLFDIKGAFPKDAVDERL